MKVLAFVLAALTAIVFGVLVWLFVILVGMSLGGNSPECRHGECNFFGDVAWNFGGGYPLFGACCALAGLGVWLVARSVRD